MSRQRVIILETGSMNGRLKDFIVKRAAIYSEDPVVMGRKETNIMVIGRLPRSTIKKDHPYHSTTGRPEDPPKAFFHKELRGEKKIFIILSRKANVFSLHVLPMLQEQGVILKESFLYVIFEGHQETAYSRWWKKYQLSLERKGEAIKKLELRSLRFIAYGRIHQSDSVDSIVEPVGFKPILMQDLNQLSKDGNTLNTGELISEDPFITYHSDKNL